MADAPSTPPGNAITRAALDRVLARAAQLQGATGEGDDAGTMTEAQIIELGKEVGLSSAAVRQALAEERSRTILPDETGIVARISGASVASAARTVPGSAAAVLSALDGWMQRNEGLEIKRRFADQLVWEARRDFFSTFRRALTVTGSGLELASADDVTAIVADVSPAHAHARIVANFRSTRNQKLTQGISVALLLSLLVGAPLAAINISLAVAVLLASAVGLTSLFVSWRNYNRLVSRAQVAIEQALDRLEFADTKQPTTAQVLLDALLGPPRPPR
ncbi:MAG TPA: hypothetical protein VGQ30_05015 [Gemmatimonadaceae bacterium]|jgi:hypothetical protein|nr:hypothetical protein [Gemmatimonadaceae bacterium]